MHGINFPSFTLLLVTEMLNQAPTAHSLLGYKDVNALNLTSKSKACVFSPEELDHLC